jgi:hypothetical protein
MILIFMMVFRLRDTDARLRGRCRRHKPRSRAGDELRGQNEQPMDRPNKQQGQGSLRDSATVAGVQNDHIGTSR